MPFIFQRLDIPELILIKPRTIRCRAEAERLGIQRVPGTAIVGEREARILYSGLPLGYEFAALLETMHMVARADSGLEKTSRERLATVQDPLHLQVFVTPG